MDQKTDLKDTKNEIKPTEEKPEKVDPKIGLSRMPIVEMDEVNIVDTETHARYMDVFTMHIPDIIFQAERKDHIFYFSCQNGLSLKIAVLSPVIFSCTYAKSNVFEEHFSYAIAPNFQKEETTISFEERDDFFNIKTDVLTCRIAKKGMLVSFYDAKENLLCEDAESFACKSTILKGDAHLSVKKKVFKDEMFFGLGDKSGLQNLRGQKLQNWCTDAFAYSETSDPLYRAIPFYYSLHNERAYGIYLDNSYRSHFDFDEKKQGVCEIATEGGTMSYYFIHGPELINVTRRYAKLTGTHELPPKWALGFHQCRWSYYPESRVREVAEEFRSRKIPCDAIYLDIDYMDDYRCFTWEAEAFPDPTKLIDDLKEEGFHTIVMIDPGISAEKGYHVYDDGMVKNVFCRRTSGELMEAPVWPVKCVFPDFTNPEVRRWWGELYRKLYLENKVSGFWNDMNEPAVFKVTRLTFPDNVSHHHDGHPCDHRKAHNIYGMQMSRATTEGLRKLNATKRPFLLTRASFSGGQRYAAVWTGDNVATWNHLDIANRQCLRLAISGFSFNGTDIGGFVDQPDGELFVRWLQLAIFHPVFRVHSMGNKDDGSAGVDEEEVKLREEMNRLDQEPWSFGEPYTKHARGAIELRYQLLAYIYHTFWEHTQDGSPVFYPMSFYDQHDEECLDQIQQFMFGKTLLVHPILRPKAKSQTVYLPKGGWYHIWSGYYFEGRRYVRVNTTLKNIPIFVKEGKVLPVMPVMQYTDEVVPEQIRMHVYYKNGMESSTFYEDDGEGYAYQQDGYTLRKYEVAGTKKSLKLVQQIEGNRADTYNTIKLEFIGINFAIQSCKVDGKVHDFDVHKLEGTALYTMIVPARFGSVLLEG